MSAPDRRGTLDRADEGVSIRRQCALIGMARSSVYRPGPAASRVDLEEQAKAFGELLAQN
jgi:putative transposase